jgi:hypothetical protein
MTRDEALELIKLALTKVLKRNVGIAPNTDLIAEGILDSLDSMVFALEIETVSGRKFPPDIDLVEAGYYKVPRLTEFLAHE